MPLIFAESVATAAMQILLWCQPKKLYLVGLDFSQARHYEEVNSSNTYLRMHHKWTVMHWKLESIRAIWKSLRDFAAEFVDYLTHVLPGDHIIRCPVTAPLCNADVITDSIAAYFWALQNGHDSLTSVTKFQHHICDENGPMNFTTGIEHKDLQNLPVWYEIANCMDIEPMDVMAKYHFQYGPNVYRYMVDPISAVDIDDLIDYRIVCAIYKYLNENDYLI